MLRLSYSRAHDNMSPSSGGRLTTRRTTVRNVPSNALVPSSRSPCTMHAFVLLASVGPLCSSQLLARGPMTVMAAATVLQADYN